MLLLGGGSNLVLPDAGLAGTVVLIRTSGSTTTNPGDGSVLLRVACRTAALGGRRCYASRNASRASSFVSIHTVLVSVYSRMTSSPFSRPRPLALTPPNGAA